MADNFLERHTEDYEQRKQQWLLRKRHIKVRHTKRNIHKPDDEAL